MNNDPLDLDYELVEDEERFRSVGITRRLSLPMERVSCWWCGRYAAGTSAGTSARPFALQRKDLAKLLAENPSLQAYLEKSLPEAYEHVTVEAMTETGRPESDFPSTCPFTLDVILDPDFLP